MPGTAEGTFTTSDGCVIAYMLHPAPRAGAPRAALVHSLALDRNIWNGVAAELAPHAHHVGQPALDRVNAEGAQYGIHMIKAEDGATRLEVGGRLTGMPVLPKLIDDGARLNLLGLNG